FDAYAAAKGNLFAHQAAGAHAVIPAGDAVCARQAARGPALAHTFGASPSATVEIGADAIVDHGSGASYPVSEIRIRGGHNLQNAAASILAARLAGAHPDSIRGTLSAFDGLPHRMRLVATIDSVEYYDDSKATNVAAAVAAIEGLGKRVVLIAGGVDKGGGYAPLVAALRAQGRAVVTLGSAASLIEGAIGDALPTQRVGSMAQAVRAARRLARPGDAVLLAPACASFDMFANYAERGDVFAAAVRELAAGGAG
ncbi:MAG: UDP-N-acetylmuramoyl-L-alanine--D-glutamate ligase, partial [Deltaproteobacteria bacterium]|nr:UDP-N-acetylmuramoyl-L-alanine--D-glutamate ligase [Deltaproteobacteria bacterium]